MKTGRNARPRRLLAAAMALMSLTEAALSAAPAAAPDNPIETIRIGNVAFELVRIPAGRFSMGSATGDPDEKPIHEVRIGHDFSMGRTEVTVRQFRAFAEATGYKTDAEQRGWANTCPQPGLHPNERGLHWRRPGFEPGDDLPVVVVSWNDAMAFCRWLSAETGRNVRLPTEAEWEYAARAGGQENSSRRPEEAAWYEGNASDCAHPVGTKQANPWGLVDMQGNAWEWCLDVWRPDYRAAAPDGGAQMHDPVVPQVVWRHVLRGGSWFTPVRQLSLTYRARYLNHFSRPDTGFRIVVAASNDRQAVAVAPLVSSNGCVDGRARRWTQDATETSRTTDTRSPVRSVLTARGVRFEFVRIPAGEFLMGGTDRIEKPAHQVRIGYDFEMGTTEVTIGQFRAFVQATGYPTDGEKVGVSWSRGPDTDWQSEDAVPWCHAVRDQSDEHPAIFISWYDAMAFCHWLSQETGQEIRLPSEAEWEHACRAGTTGLYAGELSEMGWYNYNACNRTHPVAQKQPNAWGLYDMHGNVWEWCLDFFQPNYEGAPTDGQPRWEVRSASDVVSRGGSFRNPPGWVASGCRMGTFPDASHGNNGFRLVRSDRPAAPRTAAQDQSRAPARSVPNAPARLALRVDGVTFDFARIPPGRFTMGSPHRYVDEYNWTYEMPAREVTIGYPYYLGVTEVTVEQFRLFAEQTGYVTDAEKQGRAYVAGASDWHFEWLLDWRNPGYLQTDREPVVCLGWHDAVAFCRWVSAKTGHSIRLPSEAEWEYACRAGTMGDHAGILGEMGWYAWNSAGRTHPVARKKPNAWGLYDMHGNAWEWVQDMYHHDGRNTPTDGSAWCATAEVDPRGITRGGSFYNPAWLCRSYIRMQTPLGHTVHWNNGLRLVCEVSEPRD